MSNSQGLRQQKPSSRRLREELARARYEAPLTEQQSAVLACAHETFIDMVIRASMLGYEGVVRALQMLIQQRQMLVSVEKMRSEMKAGNGTTNV